MMTNTKKISSGQLFSILFVCRIVALFTYITPEKEGAESVNSFLLAIAFVIFQVLFSVPVFLVIKKDNSGGIINNAAESSPVFGKITALIYFIAFIYAAGISLSRFELFVSTIMFPGAELYFFIALFMIVSLFGIFKGTESIGRSAVIVLFAVTVSTVFIGITVAKEFDTTNLLPVLYGGITPVLDSAFYSATRTMELVSLMIIAPAISGNIRKGFVKWISIFGITAAVLFTGIQGILGAYGDKQMFQLYSLTLIAKFSIFERLDDLLTGVWVLCTLIKIAYYCTISVKCIEQGFGKKTTKTLQAGVCAGVFAVFLLTSGTVVTFSSVVGSDINSALYIAIAAALPLAVFITGKITAKKRKKVEELCSKKQF